MFTSAISKNEGLICNLLHKIQLINKSREYLINQLNIAKIEKTRLVAQSEDVFNIVLGPYLQYNIHLVNICMSFHPFTYCINHGLCVSNVCLTCIKIQTERLYGNGDKIDIILHEPLVHIEGNLFVAQNLHDDILLRN